MSLESLNWAWKQPVPNSSAKFVLLALANRTDVDNMGRVIAFPSVEYLAKVTAQNRKTVLSNLAKLREWNLIDDTGSRVGRTKQVVVYALNCPPDLFTEQTQKRNGPKTGTVPKSSVKSPVFSGKESQKRDTDSFKDSSSIQKRVEEKPKRNSAAEGEAMQAIRQLLKGVPV